MMKKIVPYVLAALMLLGTFGHLYNPAAYGPFIPDFIPSGLANILAAIAEGVIGVALLLPKYRKLGGQGFMLLMIAFLPLHVWDLLKDNPAMGSTAGAAIRLVIQLVFIYAGWWVWKKT